MKLIKIYFILFSLTVSGLLNAQTTIEWDGEYKIQLSDFQSVESQIGDVNFYSLSTGSSFGFNIAMNNLVFMFTKNLNSKVSCTFNQEPAVLISPDSLLATQLLDFSQFEFDLNELYARKFRKSLFEEKDALTNMNDINTLYSEAQKNFIAERSRVSKITNMGIESIKLKEIHLKVVEEIELLSEYCKYCKPIKNKNK